MPYKFVDRYPRTSDTVDIGELNKHFLEMAEALSSEVSEHNLKEGAYTFKDNALCKVMVSAITPSLGLNFGGSAPHNAPPQTKANYSGTNIAFLPNSGSWETVQSITHNSTHFRVMHLMSWTCYSWTGYNSSNGGHVYSNVDDWADLTSSPSTQPWATPGFQLALRVNGTVYNVTGQANENHRPHVPIRSDPEIQNDVNLANAFDPFNGAFDGSLAGMWPGILNIRSEITSCPAQTTMALSLVDIVSVPPGNVTIELIARRLTGQNGFRKDSDDAIAFLNRQLVAFIYPDARNRNRAIEAVGVSPIRKGDAATTTQLNTNTLQKIKTVVDDLDLSAIKKFNRYHNPEALHRASNGAYLAIRDQVDYGTSPITIDNFLPSLTTTFLPVGTYTGGTGWTPLTTTSGGTTEFLLDLAGGTLIPTNTKTGWFHVTAHVHIQGIKKVTTGTYPQLENTNEEYHMASAALYYLQGSTRVVLPGTVVNVSRTTTPDPNSTRLDLATVTINGNIHVPLMNLMQCPFGSADITGFGICVSAINWENTARVNVVVKNASISGEFYKQ
jgi:hypothetical protein